VACSLCLLCGFTISWRQRCWQCWQCPVGSVQGSWQPWALIAAAAAAAVVKGSALPQQECWLVHRHPECCQARTAAAATAADAALMWSLMACCSCGSQRSATQFCTTSLQQELHGSCQVSAATEAILAAAADAPLSWLWSVWQHKGCSGLLHRVFLIKLCSGEADVELVWGDQGGGEGAFPQQ